MKKGLIIFGSTTGNTEEMASIVQKGLDEGGMEAEVKNVVDASVEDLTSNYDLVLLGCPAYGDDSVELQEDFDDFYEQMDGISLKGKQYAVFAPGDSSYEFFCGSVDMLEDKLESLGGSLSSSGLKIDGDPGDAADEIMDWARSLLQ